jgi:ActR/RegA family two-component response regulator/AraC-like DNA-binding protein
MRKTHTGLPYGIRSPQLQGNSEDLPDGSRSARILWIDDNIHPADPIVRYLELEGFIVTIALTGEEGIQFVAAEPYGVILLDQRLPDVQGIQIISRLTSYAPHSRIIVLTGFGGINDAVAAIRAGAIDYRTKPIDVDDLATLLKGLVENHPVRPYAAAGCNRYEIERDWLNTVLPEFERCGSKDELAFGTLRTLLDRRLTLRAFPGCAAGFRLTCSREHTSPVDVAAEIRRHINEALATQLPAHPKLLLALASMESGGPKRSQAALAAEMGVSRSHLSKLFSQETGRHSRDWLRAAVMRAALRSVAETAERIDQIAYMLGYESLSHFDHDFGRMFGLSPRSLRRAALKAHGRPGGTP